MHLAPRRLTVLLAALALAALALGLTACGSGDSKSVVEGESVELGDLSYNVVFSRYLNPNDVEDAAYLVGQPKPQPGTNYFGVFMQVENSADEPQQLPAQLTISDVDHNEFSSVPSKSLFALQLGGKIGAEDELPTPDSTAQQGPIQGSLVLFQLPDSVSENRPLTMSIPGQDGPAEVTLDL